MGSTDPTELRITLSGTLYPLLRPEGAKAFGRGDILWTDPQAEGSRVCPH